MSTAQWSWQCCYQATPLPGGGLWRSDCCGHGRWCITVTTSLITRQLFKKNSVGHLVYSIFKKGTGLTKIGSIPLMTGIVIIKYSLIHWLWKIIVPGNNATWLVRPRAHTSRQWLLWCHGAQTESWLTAFLCKAFGIEVSALNPEVRLFSNGVTVDLSHERYLQWQQHAAEGRQTSDAVWTRSPLASNRNSSSTQTSSSVMWCGSHCLPRMSTAGTHCKSWILLSNGSHNLTQSISKWAARASNACVLMHFSQYVGSLGLF